MGREKKKLDLRRERWKNGFKGEKYICLEVDIPDKDVLLHDFDAWCIVLINGLISDTEQEDAMLERVYSSLSSAKKKRMKEKNWKKIFDISPLTNKWTIRWSSIQATFWKLKKEQIKKVRFFIAASK